MSIVLSVITSLKEFSALSGSWERFRERQNDNAICNSWDWLNTWISVYGRRKDKLYIHLWHHNKEIVGIIPCYLKVTFAGNELRFLATGEPVKSEICSEFQDFQLSTEFEEEILQQFTNRIMVDNNISAITFNDILTTSKAYKWLETLNKQNKIQAIKSSGKRYIIPVKQDRNIQVSSFQSKNIKRHAKKFLADNHWRIVKVNDNEALTEFYPQLIKEHNDAWRKKDKTGAFEQADFITFHRSFSRAMLAKNKLVAFKIEIDDEVSALFYGFIDGNTLCYYQSAVNHESKLSSAGVAMHLVALDIAREHNLAFYDLMKGSNSSYKTRYIKSDIEVVSISLCTKKYHYLIYLIQLTKKAKIIVERILKKYG